MGFCMKKVILANNNIYHVYNRGALKEPIFFEDRDYVRFVEDLHEFNNARSALDPRLFNRGSTSVDTEVEPLARAPLVSILAWCLMPNHFHLLLEQREDAGVTHFMAKLGTGYTLYINKKYERSGHVFQGRFKARHVDGESYFLHISRYIHLNPVDIIEPGWKETGIKDWDKTRAFLEGYRWSSYPDWIGRKNFPSILGKAPYKGYFKDAEAYKQFVREWTERDYEHLKSMVAG